jgi:glutamate dehydrogenase/leucine dehydrogenase
VIEKNKSSAHSNTLSQLCTQSFNDVYQKAKEYKVDMRKGSIVLAVSTVAEATKTRGIWHKIL